MRSPRIAEGMTDTLKTLEAHTTAMGDVAVALFNKAYAENPTGANNSMALNEASARYIGEQLAKVIPQDVVTAAEFRYQYGENTFSVAHPSLEALEDAVPANLRGDRVVHRTVTVARSETAWTGVER